MHLIINSLTERDIGLLNVEQWSLQKLKLRVINFYDLPRQTEKFYSIFPTIHKEFFKKRDWFI